MRHQHEWPSTQPNGSAHNPAAHHRAAHNPAAQWCTARMCAVLLGCVVSHVIRWFAISRNTGKCDLSDWCDVMTNFLQSSIQIKVDVILETEKKRKNLPPICSTEAYLGHAKHYFLHPTCYVERETFFDTPFPRETKRLHGSVTCCHRHDDAGGVLGVSQLTGSVAGVLKQFG